jgi:L-asparaginase
MHSYFVGALLLAAVGIAAPTAVEIRDIPKNDFLNITYSSSSASHKNSSLPSTLVIATGGTIAGSSASAQDDTHYMSGVVGVAALVQGQFVYIASLKRRSI